MKKLINRKIMVFVLFATLVAVKHEAKAENPAVKVAQSIQQTQLPIDIGSVLGIIESLGLTGGLPSVLNAGGCQVGVTYGFPFIDLRFVPSLTCQLNGNIRLGLMPLYTDVNVEFMNNKMVKRITATFTMTIVRNKAAGTTTVNWKLWNGGLEFSLQPGMPTQTYSAKGQGTRVRTNDNLIAHSQTDFFDKASGIGISLVRDQNGSTKSLQSCTILGANAADISSGMVVDCKTNVPAEISRS